MRLWLVDGRVEAFQSRLAGPPQALVKVYLAYVALIFNLVNQPNSYHLDSYNVFVLEMWSSCCIHLAVRAPSACSLSKDSNFIACSVTAFLQQGTYSLYVIRLTPSHNIFCSLSLGKVWAAGRWRQNLHPPFLRLHTADPLARADVRKD